MIAMSGVEAFRCSLPTSICIIDMIPGFMKKATDALINDHKMIRKLLDRFHPDQPRFPEIASTLKRVVLSHAWFEDQVFLPAFKTIPLMNNRYVQELTAEHKDIDYFMQLIHQTQPSRELEIHVKQFRAILENHLQKEEDALFPLAESLLNKEGMNNLSAEMERRQHEAQKLFNS